MGTQDTPQSGTYDYYIALAGKWASKAEKHKNNAKLAKADLAMATYNHELAQEALAQGK